ncbi:MAG: NAD(P)-dependent oxidoreductase [Deltaproteobacteria bacterium]|nr:NAD(P)-dependent oxidoreductase [Deltaproteobacteria bacterium]
MMGEEKFLVTGAMGCIGAWVVRNLLRDGVEAIIFDQSDNDQRLKLLLNKRALAKVQYIQGSITNLDDIKKALHQSGATHVIHLAALQFPFCNADPGLGAQVNVVGTANVFEAIRSAGNQIGGMSYASSIAAYGPDHLYPQKPLQEDVPLHPDTFYGTYKQTNENTARVFWKEWKVGSVGLRPATIYGVARDQGLTAGLSKATLAAAVEQPFHISFGGPTAFQYVDDTARIFIDAARAAWKGAIVCNMHNIVTDVREFVETLQGLAPNAQITYEKNSKLPFPVDFDCKNLRRIIPTVPLTPLTEAVGKTLDLFRKLASEGRVNSEQLE